MNRFKAMGVMLGIALTVLSLPSLAAIRLTPITTSGFSSPVFVGNAGDGTNRLFVVEQAGIIKVLQPGSSTPTVFLDIRARITAGGERGLLGLAFHQNYRFNGRFFVFYTRAPEGTLVLAEYRVSTNPNVASAAEIVLLNIQHEAAPNQNGGMLAFGPDGYLYVGVGDGGQSNDPPNNAQNLHSLLGKILRLDVDRPDPDTGALYSSPGDNPYAGPAIGFDEIYSSGWRNPWRFSFDRAAPHAMWVADVGQDAREEVNSPIVKGGSYGWRVYEGSACTTLDPALCNPANDYIPPLFEYGHAGGRCAITGGYVYRGFESALPTGTYVYADFCTGEILGWNGSTQSLLLDTTMRISSFGEDERGELYVVDIGGTVSRIDTTTPAAVVIGFYNATLDHYFMTADAAEAAAIDAGGAGPGWKRTGTTFKVGGNTPVCRFYGSITPGPNSHFYTLDAAECAALRSLQASTPPSQKRWNYEGVAFSSTPPANGTCPAATIPVYRYYNNGFARGVDSNHLITTSFDEIQSVASRGWLSEGVAMCAPR